MTIDRREFARIVGAGALGLAGGISADSPIEARSHRPVRAAAKFSLDIRGGYVYVLEVKDSANHKGTVRFGPIAKPQSGEKEEAGVYEQHHLVLTVNDGQALDPETQKPLPNLGGWLLSVKKKVTFAPGSSEVPDYVALPPRKAAGGSWNGLDKLPDMFHQARQSGVSNPGLTPEARWPLDTLVTLGGGTLQVIEPAVDAARATVDFGQPNSPEQKPVAVSDALRYSCDALDGAINVLVDGAIGLTLQPKPGSTTMSAVLMPLIVPLEGYRASDKTHTHAAGPIAHFAMFYRMLSAPPAVSERRVPHRTAALRTPGIFCPPGAYIV
jgi:hypothetical protein